MICKYIKLMLSRLRSASGVNVRRDSLAAVALASLLSWFPLAAQQSSSIPPPDDPSVYHLFFNFHHNLSLNIDSKKLKDPAGGAQFEKSVARLLRVRFEDLAKARSVSDQYVAGRAQWQSDLKAYIDQVRARKQQPDPAMLSQFEQRKQQLLNSALFKLGSIVDADSWAGLRAFINDQCRLGITTVQFKGVPVPPSDTPKP